ncbi:LPXTG cell wall anchor domain-containing protein [Micromonospora sp. NPDC047707]|uniref:LPXTG cell wall anchor domain-containing protein n=1 Tax=Micromonospora sp. NPDC047707 TaxID=3154498 RepID=UPI0034554474
MLKHSTRRWFAGIGVAGALVAASATPATAQAPDVELGVYMNDLTIATDSAGKMDGPLLFASEPVVVEGLALRFDYRALAGKIEVKSQEPTLDGCEAPEAGVLVCTSPFETELYDWQYGVLQVLFTATDDAAEGDSGDLKITVSADGFDPATYTSTVRVGEGVDLAGTEDETTVSAAPGASFTSPITLRNAGETTVKGAVAIFDTDYGIRAGKRYSNCTYEGDALRTCRFDDTVSVGESLRADLAYALGADTYAPGNEYAYYSWMTVAEFEDFAAYVKDLGGSVGEPGDGPALTLSTAAVTRGVQADTNPDNNWSGLEVTVTGKNGADLEAIGDKVAGKAGDEVVATVGFRNNGPATLDYTRSWSSVTYMTVEIPAGTTAIGAPDVCLPVKGEDEMGEPGEPGARKYFCYSEPFVKAGEEPVVEFALKIDKVVPNATGTVKINEKCECDGGFPNDLKPANDTAKLVVNATGNGGGAGGGDGDDPTLPITGDSTTLVTVIGGLLLIAGAAGYVVTRRRKTRFVA